MVETDAQTEVMQVLDRFMESANTQDSDLQKSTFHFPLIRIAGTNVLIFTDKDDVWKFPSISSEKGWHRSAWDSRDVIQTSENKVHVAARFTRYAENDDPIASYDTFYAATRRDNRWGIQLRSSFADEKDHPSDSETGDDPEAMAMQVMDAFLSAFNTLDSDGLKATFNYPHIRVSAENVLIFEDTEGPWKFGGILYEKEWHHSVWDFRKVFQKSPGKVHVMAGFTRFRENNTPIGSHESLYIITRHNGHWGIQARSSFAR
jgi:hypothetical protein